MNEQSIPGVDSEMPSHAISLYNQGEAIDDFPVLKAFQQYIDAEQAKARKRLITLGIFFSALMFVVIAVFVVLLINVTNRNQALNDRLVEFAMKERTSNGPVVVQPAAPAPDNSALIALTSKLEEMQKKLTESQTAAANAEKALAEADQKAKAAVNKPQGPTPQELEIQRLKTMLSMEKEKTKLEAERKHQEELEAYRRKHYPELYGKKTVRKSIKKTVREEDIEDEDKDEIDDNTEEKDDIDALIEDLDDDSSIDYFVKASPSRSSKKTAEKELANDPARQDVKSPAEDTYSIPVDIKGQKSRWRIPE